VEKLVLHKQELKKKNRVKLNANLNSQKMSSNRRRKKNYYENNKEYISQQKKEYNERNKEYFDKVKKEYYENNKEKFTEKINCKCGGIYTYKHKARHFKTNKHLEYIESLEKD
jgi:hypothetical protein